MREDATAPAFWKAQQVLDDLGNQSWRKLKDNFIGTIESPKVM